MIWLKKNIVAFVELFLDTVLDSIFPYKLLSKTPFKNVVFPKWFYFDYVLNQKIQRLQLVNILRQEGIENSPVFKVWWSRGLRNFGDELMGYLLARVAGADCVFDRKKSFIGIGSTVRFAHDQSVVWGSGVIRTNEIMREKPKCLAVRGPLTRENLLKNEVSCPEVYGDPTMLFPLFYLPEKKGFSAQALIVPHFKHFDFVKQYSGFEYLDIRVYSIDDIENIINCITSAPRVITSSLHVFIFCVAYGVPVTVFKLEGTSIGGDNIKFDDFCYGVGLEPITIHNLNELGEENLGELVQKAKLYTPNWSAIPLLKSLYDFFPSLQLSNFIDQVQKLENTKEEKLYS